MLNPTSISERIILLEGWRAALLAFAAGALSALALAPVHFFPILFVTMPVFVWLLDGSVATVGSRWLTKFWPAFRTGWLFGFGYFLAGLWWLGKAFLVDADGFLWLLPFAVLGLPAVLGLFWGLACALARLAWREGWSRLVALAAALTLMEYLRSVIWTGFPWNLFGYAFMPVPMMMQTSALIGTFGVTFLAFFVALSPGIFAPGDGRNPRRMRAILASAFVLLVAHISYGALILSSASDHNVPRMMLRLVQPNIDQREKWQDGAAPKIFQTYLDLSKSNTGPQTASAAAFTHIIWPESAFPFILAEQSAALAAIDDLLPDTTTLITGGMRREIPVDGSKTEHVFNSALVLNGAGEITAARDKTRLVPFGEFLPFQTTLESLGFRQLTDQRGGFAAGSRRETVESQKWPAFLPLICYEIVYPGDMAAAGARPQWLVNLTNDAWFGFTSGPYQHAHQARVRGVEEGLPIVRVANNGISFVSDPYGRVRKSLPLGAQAVLDSRLPQALPPTFFARMGNVPVMVLVCMIFLILVVIRPANTNRLQ